MFEGEDEESLPTAARRCSRCDLNWPVDIEFRVCASCQHATVWSADHEPMPIKEAWSLKHNFDFDRFYWEEWDQSQPPERLETFNLPSYGAGWNPFED